MTPEQEELIEAMAKGIFDDSHAGFEIWRDQAEVERMSYEGFARAALLAAQERGWVLARPPTGKSIMTNHDGSMRSSAEMNGAIGFNSCLDAIETLKLDEGESE